MSPELIDDLRALYLASVRARVRAASEDQNMVAWVAKCVENSILMELAKVNTSGNEGIIR